MHIRLEGLTAVVTGSTKGIGFGIAEGLARTGAHVVVNGREQDAVDQAVAALEDAVPGASVTGVAADLGSAEGCAAFVEAVPRCDILVNNVGIFAEQDFFETSDATWQRFFEVNVMSGVRLSRALAPAMVDRGWGRIVFIASESALNIPAAMVHYGFTKTANLSVARGLAKRLAGTGVTVNSVLPGPTLSDGFKDMFADEVERSGKSFEQVGAAFIAEHRSSSILQRPASVEEVANMVVYTCSRQASATTGASLRVEGGIVDTL